MGIPIRDPVTVQPDQRMRASAAVLPEGKVIGGRLVCRQVAGEVGDCFLFTLSHEVLVYHLLPVHHILNSGRAM